LAQLSIAIGAILVLLSVLFALSMYFITPSKTDTLGFGFVLLVFPLLVGLLLILPATLYRLFHLIKAKGKQQKNNKLEGGL